MKCHMDSGILQCAQSRPARALWIEIRKRWRSGSAEASRPARALWIEIAKDGKMQEVAGCRGPRGPCGLKSKNRYKKYSSASRGPRGPCGLKYTHVENQHPDSLSRPARALWIEIVLEDAKVYVGWGRGPRGPCGLKLSGRLIYILHGTVEAREGLVD